MKKFANVFCKISSLILALMFAVSVMTSLPTTASAATATKVNRSYDIAVVFDNSGSMYNDQAWCRAKYAMEIFAAMLNYDNGDRLRIFPMWEVTTDKTKPTRGGSYAPIEIRSKSDIDKISNMYTVNPSNTPFAPVNEARDALMASSATERWLIVLTDGEFNQIGRKDKISTMSSAALKTNLINAAVDGIKVQYLGFGKATVLSAEPSKNFYAIKATDTSLKDDLIGICNTIFQRAVLPENRLNGKSLKIDLSMKSVIVFAQGSNAKITSLVNSSGKKIKIKLDSGQRKYSTIKAKGKEKAPVDNTLAGQVVTFSSCPKGEYTLNYSGADAIQIFYEPDVDIKVTLTDSKGKVVDGTKGQITAGEYTVKSSIVDSKTGKDVTNHELMGKDVKLVTKVKTSGDSDYTEYENGAKIKFNPDESTEIYVEGKYLTDYTITSRNNSDLDWLSNLKFVPKDVDFALDAVVTQPGKWYKTSKHDDWEPIKVLLTADGKPLTEAQLEKTKLKIATTNGLKFRYERIPGQSAYNVYIAQDEKGKYVKPDTGTYKIKASAEFVDKYGTVLQSEDTEKIKIKWYSSFWRWLIWPVIILIIILLITAIRNYPVFPTSMYLFVKRNSRPIKINGTSVGLSTDLYPGEIRCEGKACTPLKNRGKTTASVEVKNIRPVGSVNWYEIDGSRFKKVNGRYVNEDGDTIDKVVPKVIISDDTELKWNTNRHTVTGRIYINHID